MNFVHHRLQQWISFFKNHMQLTHLRIIEGYTLVPQPTPLNELTTDLPNLIDVDIKFNKYYGVEHIIRFIEAHRNLKKFHFNFEFIRRLFPLEDKVILLQRFGNEWDIKCNEPFEASVMLGLTFEKKNSSLVIL